MSLGADMPLYLDDGLAAGSVERNERRIRARRIGVFEDFLNTDKRIIALYGGARSGKSVAVAQHLTDIFLNGDDQLIFITRKTLPALKITAYSLIREILDGYGAPYEHNRADMQMSHRSNRIIFKSMDDPEKVKSFEANHIWMEEPTENTRDDFNQLLIRLSRPNAKGTNHMYLTFNPSDALHWTVTEVLNGNRSDTAIMHSTYQDNPFLSRDVIDILEGFKNGDQDYYRIYTLGQPGMMQNLIYSNWGTALTPIDEPNAYGIDWGYNNPTAMVAYYDIDDQPHLHELMYRSRMVMPEVLDELRDLGVAKDVPMFCDPSRPDLIEELHNAGYNAQPAVNDVLPGIMYCKGKRITWSVDSVHAINEMRGYKWERRTDETVTDKPVKVNDHLMDAMRYAVFSFARLHGDTKGADMPLVDNLLRMPELGDSRNIPGM